MLSSLVLLPLQYWLETLRTPFFFKKKKKRNIQRQRKIKCFLVTCENTPQIIRITVWCFFCLGGGEWKSVRFYYLATVLLYLSYKGAQMCQILEKKEMGTNSKKGFSHSHCMSKHTKQGPCMHNFSCSGYCWGLLITRWEINFVYVHVVVRTFLKIPDKKNEPCQRAPQIRYLLRLKPEQTETGDTGMGISVSFKGFR